VARAPWPMANPLLPCANRRQKNNRIPNFPHAHSQADALIDCFPDEDSHLTMFLPCCSALIAS
ncbi:MAG: hypothetical protein ACKPKO_50670, partial [Candidatus Fonsibacter sp.]